jgi:hypothetical protein
MTNTKIMNIKITGMKTKFLGYLFLSLTIFSACNKNDNDPVSTTELSAVATSGTWRVTYFFEDNRDQTSVFTGYTFTFNGNNAVTAIKGSSSVVGSWATGTDDSRSKLVLAFASPSVFEELNEDWLVIESTGTKIGLQHKSGGNGDTDFLTFEKN